MSKATPPRPADLIPQELHELRARWPSPPLSAAAARQMRDSLSRQLAEAQSIKDVATIREDSRRATFDPKARRAYLLDLCAILPALDEAIATMTREISRIVGDDYAAGRERFEHLQDLRVIVQQMRRQANTGELLTLAPDALLFRREGLRNAIGHLETFDAAADPLTAATLSNFIAQLCTELRELEQRLHAATWAELERLSNSLRLAQAAEAAQAPPAQPAGQEDEAEIETEADEADADD